MCRGRQMTAADYPSILALLDALEIHTSVFSRANVFCASDPAAAGCFADCPPATAHTVSITMENTERDDRINLLLDEVTERVRPAPG